MDRLDTLSLDTDTNAFAVEPCLWRKVVVLDLHIAVVRLIQLHVHSPEDARGGEIEFLIRKDDAGADAGPDESMEERCRISQGPPALEIHCSKLTLWRRTKGTCLAWGSRPSVRV